LRSSAGKTQTIAVGVDALVRRDFLIAGCRADAPACRVAHLLMRSLSSLEASLGRSGSARAAIEMSPMRSRGRSHPDRECDAAGRARRGQTRTTG
jgi:hypothetical protein